MCSVHLTLVIINNMHVLYPFISQVFHSLLLTGVCEVVVQENQRSPTEDLCLDVGLIKVRPRVAAFGVGAVKVVLGRFLKLNANVYLFLKIFSYNHQPKSM